MPVPNEAPYALLADPPEVFVVDTTRVSCEGVGGALGHPRIFMEMGDSGFVECGYCDRRFVLKAGPSDLREENAPGNVGPETH
jgi:uncharacterized Zn-finger protein